MKIGITLFIALVTVGAVLVGVQSRKSMRVVHAQTGCDATSLNGAYGYTLTGFYFDNAGNTNFFSGAGVLTSDGQGNITAMESDSFSGQVVRADALTGTYTMNSNCTGSMTTTSKTSGAANYDIVLTNGHNVVQLVEVDTNTNVTGQAARQ